MTRSPIVILAGPYRSTRILYHYLSKRFEITKVLIERRPSRLRLLNRRLNRLGLARTVGQLCFRAIVVPFLQAMSVSRLREVDRIFQFDDREIPAELIKHIASVNEPETVELLRSLNPAVVVVNGTRIIAQDVFDRVQAPFANLHAGITPRYRGVHGAYWALVKRDLQNCGATVHLMDKGIDTGPVLSQARVEPGPRDNFVTYPSLQLGAVLPLLESILEELIAGGRPGHTTVDAESQLWSHPTLLEYVNNRISLGVK